MIVQSLRVHNPQGQLVTQNFPLRGVAIWVDGRMVLTALLGFFSRPSTKRGVSAMAVRTWALWHFQLLIPGKANLFNFVVTLPPPPYHRAQGLKRFANHCVKVENHSGTSCQKMIRRIYLNWKRLSYINYKNNHMYHLTITIFPPQYAEEHDFIFFPILFWTKVLKIFLINYSFVKQNLKCKCHCV